MCSSFNHLLKKYFVLIVNKPLSVLSIRNKFDFNSVVSMVYIVNSLEYFVVSGYSHASTWSSHTVCVTFIYILWCECARFFSSFSRVSYSHIPLCTIFRIFVYFIFLGLQLPQQSETAVVKWRVIGRTTVSKQK